MGVKTTIEVTCDLCFKNFHPVLTTGKWYLFADLSNYKGIYQDALDYAGNKADYVITLYYGDEIPENDKIFCGFDCLGKYISKL